jgi:hypothetical protein
MTRSSPGLRGGTAARDRSGSMLPTTATLKGHSLVFKLIWLALFVPMFIAMFVYELVMFMLGRQRYSKRQYEREFDHGYSPLRYGRQETKPKHPDVWNHALEKSYEKFATDLRLAALMGIIYRFKEPKTIEEFDWILSDQIESLGREPDLSGNMTAVRWWNPADVINFLDEHYKKHSFADFTHYYVNEKGSTSEWRILKLGLSEFKPEERSRSISYHEEYLCVTPIQYVEYSFSGDKTSISNIRFCKSADADFAGKAVSVLCNFAITFVSAMFDEKDAAAIISRLNVSEPQPFECVVQSTKMKLDWKISRPYWSEPDQVFASFTIEKV